MPGLARAGINCAAAASGPGARPAPKTSTAFPVPAGLSPAGCDSPQNLPGGTHRGLICLHRGRAVMINPDFGRSRMPCSVPALGSGFGHCPNSASLSRWEAGALWSSSRCWWGSGAQGPAQPGLQGPQQPQALLWVCSCPRRCRSTRAWAWQHLWAQGLWGSPGCRARLREAAVHPDMPGRHRPPPADSAPVCRSRSRPRKPQAKSPHPSAGAFPSASTGMAAFPRPGAGSEPLGLRGKTAGKPQDF